MNAESLSNPPMGWNGGGCLCYVYLKLDEILRRLVSLENKVDLLGVELMKELDDLKAQVTACTTEIDSAKTLLVGLKTALDAAIAALPDKSQLVELSTQLATKTQELTDAVVANTPSAPTP